MTVPPWSYSSLSKFETCPRQFAAVKVHKTVKEVQGEAAAWGNTVHLALEQRVLNKTPLPQGMQHYEKVASQFDNAAGNVFTETQIALNKNLEICKWDDTSAWVRGIIDVGLDTGRVALLLDWKTGKVKHDMDQLELFAGLYLQANPAIVEARTGYVWLAYNKVTRETFTRADLSRIWEDFTVRSNRLAQAYATDRWPARPSGLCKKWCPVTRNDCEFSGRD